MAVPEKRKSRNITASILRHVNTNFTVAHSLEDNVNYRDKTFDVSDLDYWVSIDPLEENAGRKGHTLMQFAIYSRVGGRQPGETGDQYGDKMDELADWLQDAMHVDSIPIYDYSTKASPAIITNAQIIVRKSDGTFREPEDDARPEPVDGIASRVLTYRFITLSDVAQADRYYD